ncbi:MAG: hypothetical protein PHI12_05165 [Dehalococcoidales bacterium]|nr:hypothetical protein [Dehalococcoidales bacterium]
MSEKTQDDTTVKERIMGLLDKGYVRGQLIRDFGFAERTVDSSIKDYKEQHPEEPNDTKKSEDTDPKSLALPAKLDIKQVIVPEYLIKHLSFVNGDQRQTFVDALLVYESARRSVMADVAILQGLAAAQAEVTETQLKVLREAQNDSRQVVEAISQEMATAIAQRVQEVTREASLAASPNPTASMMAQTMQPYLAQALGRLMGMFGGFGQPVASKTGAPTPQFGIAPQGHPPVIPGIQQASEEEIKEVFND